MPQQNLNPFVHPVGRKGFPGKLVFPEGAPASAGNGISAEMPAPVYSPRFLQMQNSGLDLLGLAHVPEVLAQIAAGAAGNVHLGVVLVAAVGALPLVVIIDNDLPVVAADLTVVALGVELGVLDVVVDEADHVLHGLQIVAHVGDLHIGDGAAGGDLLELAQR